MIRPCVHVQTLRCLGMVTFSSSSVTDIRLFVHFCHAHFVTFRMSHLIKCLVGLFISNAMKYHCANWWMPILLWNSVLTLTITFVNNRNKLVVMYQYHSKRGIRLN